MGSMTVKPVSPLLTGATITKTDTGGSTSSIIVDHTTAQSSLNLSTLVVFFENYSSTVSMVVTLGVGEDYSSIGQGAAAAITVATAASIVVGGKTLEGARFLTDDDQIIFAITTAATAYVYATMAPFIICNN